jgi:signal transduction histidine kinase
VSTGSSTQVTRRGVFPRLRDTRIRAKLALILVVPLVAVLALAGVRLVDVGQQASAAGQVQKLTKLGTDVSELAQLLHVERMEAAAYLSGADPLDKYNAAIRNTDDHIQTYFADRDALDNPPSAVVDRLNRIDDHLHTMDATRNVVSQRNGIAVAEAVSRYSVVITDLVSYGDAVSQFAGDGDVADGLRALAAFAKAKAGTAEQEAVAYAARVSRDNSAEQRTAFIATQTSQQEALTAFSLAASPAQQTLVDSVVTGDAVNLADQVSTEISRGEAVAPSDVTASLGAVVDLMRWAEQQLESEILKKAGDDRDSVVRQTAVEAVLVLLVLAVAIALAVVLARSLNLSLRRLREGALSVAHRDLPEVVSRLRDSRNLAENSAEEIVEQVRDPIRLNNRDEIGQVAQAFNVVHREAVRIAAEQAALRTSVSTMFLNLARRSQSLVDRMIGELDTIERTEEDPKRLARLFELDHLATRMRRNDENLLVLAGADSSAPRREDALLVDALRAAQSEVELYNRIEFGTVDTDVSIVAMAVNDVVRLVAELLDNATRFSPPTTIVVADARRIRDYVVIQVEDRGLGMSEEQMDQLNRRLAEPPSVDVAAFRLMGLAVVGRLAARYGIRVELRPNLEGGTVAQVTLPGSIVVLPNRRDALRGGSGAPELGGPELGGSELGGPSGGWETLPAGRTATATLPALSPAPMPDPDRPVHPSLPMFPSQRPPAEIEPTPDRPPLPTRVARPAEVETSGFAAPTAAMPVITPAPNGFTPAPPAVPSSPDPNGWGAALAAMPPVPSPPIPAPAEERNDAPIFVEMQQSWFRQHDQSPEEWGMPTAGYAPPPNSPALTAPTAAVPEQRAASSSRSDSALVTSTGGPDPRIPSTPPAAAAATAASPISASPAVSAPPARDASTTTGQNGSVPKPRPAAEDRWKTAADEGWKRAMQAAEPVDAGTTKSGLPKRVPQAQLVPGGVQSGGQRTQNRRTPDEVRGLLSAYHRGVQRGRTDGVAESSPAFQAKEKEQ